MLTKQGGYGSYEIVLPWEKVKYSESRFEFPPVQTCNTSEYLSLLRALKRLELERKNDLRKLHVTVWGDSQIVIFQVSRQWKSKRKHLSDLRDECIARLKRFGQYTVKWHRRHNNVARFGH